MQKGKFLIWVVCRSKKRRRRLTRIIRRRFGSLFTVECFAKMDDLPRETAEEKVAIVMSLVGGKADVLWEIGHIYRRKFYNIPLFLEVEKDISQEGALRFVDLGGWHVFSTEENVADIIESVIGPLYDYPNISEVTKRYVKIEKILPQKIKMVLKIVLQLF